MSGQKVNVLWVDAWAGCCGCDHRDEDAERCWSWNDWRTIGQTVRVPETLEEMLTVLDRCGREFDRKIAGEEFDLEDDGYNVTLVERDSRRPMYAVEYGANL